MKKKAFVYLLLLVSLTWACSQGPSKADVEGKSGTWLLIESDDGQQGYLNAQGDTVIPLGKYNFCFTDSFKTFAIVASKEGVIGINRKEEKLFDVFVYDNGPDYVSEGLFRIVKNQKIGYANKAGEVVITPTYACAYPFQDGKAKVALECTVEKDGEHSFWESDAWFFIDKKGNKVVE